MRAKFRIHLLLLMLIFISSCLDNEKMRFIDANSPLCQQSFCDDFRTNGINLGDYQCKEICDCILENLHESGKKDYYLEQSNNMKYGKSMLQNEFMVDIGLPCLEPILPEVFEEITGIDFENVDVQYNPKDIIGDNDYSIVKVTDFVSVLNLDLSFGNGVSGNFIFDTGASHIIINNSFKKEMIEKGLLLVSDYLVNMDVMLAHGETVEAELINIKSVYIGGCKVKNVKDCVIDEALLLCGLGLLKKFKRWEFDSSNQNLTLYK